MRTDRFVACAVTLAAGMLNAQTVDRTKPPQTPALPVYHVPPVYETKLSNGLSVVLLEDTRFPMITVRLGFEAGSRYDPPELRGLSEGTASLLNEGTKRRTSRQIAEFIGIQGATLTHHRPFSWSVPSR